MFTDRSKPRNSHRRAIFTMAWPTNRATELAGMAFLAAYGFGAFSPLAIGGLLDATGGFTAGNIALIATTLALGLAIQRLDPPRALEVRSKLRSDSS